MKKVYIVFEDDKIRSALDETYDTMLQAVRRDMPAATSVVENEELSKLHDMLALMRTQHIVLRSYDWAGKRCYTLQINEDKQDDQ